MSRPDVFGSTLLTELAPDGTTVLYTSALTHDLAGRLATETLNPLPTPTTASVAQTFNVDNRLLTQDGAAVSFDADGNLTTIASGVAPASFTYDARNRLTAAGSLSYDYDAEGHRVSVTDGSGTTHFAISPNAALDQVLVRTAPGGTKTFYVYGLGLLHEETGSTVRYYHADRRGDIVMLTDSTGAVTDRISYGVYGEPAARTGSTDTPFLFNGLYGVQTDSNGLYYLRARYYHPALRRFLNQDTVFGDLAISASLNRFAYANGCPVTVIDPFGLAAMDLDPNSKRDDLIRQAGIITLRMNDTLSDMNVVEGNIRLGEGVSMVHMVLSEGFEAGAVTGKGVGVLKNVFTLGGYLTRGAGTLGAGGRVLTGMSGTTAGDLVNASIGGQQMTSTGGSILTEAGETLLSAGILRGAGALVDEFRDATNSGVGAVNSAYNAAGMLEGSYYRDAARLKAIKQQLSR